MRKENIDKTMRNHLIESFAEYIKSKKMRQTPERFAILDKALDQKGHFDIDSIHKDIEADFHVSRTTVYNTMELLCDCNIFRKHFLNGNTVVFERFSDNHLHLICTECGKLKVIPAQSVEECLPAFRFKGFHPSFSSLNVYGLCAACWRKAKNKTKH